MKCMKTPWLAALLYMAIPAAAQAQEILGVCYLWDRSDNWSVTPIFTLTDDAVAMTTWAQTVRESDAAGADHMHQPGPHYDYDLVGQWERFAEAQPNYNGGSCAFTTNEERLLPWYERLKSIRKSVEKSRYRDWRPEDGKYVLEARDWVN